MEANDFLKNIPEKNTEFKIGRQPIITNESRQAIQASWETGFSSPTMFDSKKFRLLVHGIQSPSTDALQMLFMITQMKEGSAEPMGEKIDLMSQPSRISEIPILSTSVITQDHTETYGHAGFVLKAPFENVLDMHPEDAGTDFSRPQSEISKSRRAVGTLDELMNQRGNSWNEVRLMGKTQSGEIKITACWYKVNKKGEPLDNFTADEVSRVANRLCVPVLKIPDVSKLNPHYDRAPEVLMTIVTSKESETGKPYEKPSAFAINRGGLRYILDFTRNNFYTLDDETKAKPMTDQDFTFSFNLLKKELSLEQQVANKQIIDSLQEKFISAKGKKLSW